MLCAGRIEEKGRRKINSNHPIDGSFPFGPFGDAIWAHSRPGGRVEVPFELLRLLTRSGAAPGVACLALVPARGSFRLYERGSFPSPERAWACRIKRFRSNRSRPCVLRAALDDKQVQIVAVNDLTRLTPAARARQVPHLIQRMTAVVTARRARRVGARGQQIQLRARRVAPSSAEPLDLTARDPGEGSEQPSGKEEIGVDNRHGGLHRISPQKGE